MGHGNVETGIVFVGPAERHAGGVFGVGNIGDPIPSYQCKTR